MDLASYFKQLQAFFTKYEANKALKKSGFALIFLWSLKSFIKAQIEQ